jgi:putative transposase
LNKVRVGEKEQSVKEEGLQMRHKVPRRRVAAKLRDDRTEATRPNECWSMHFMSDELFDGRRLRILTIVDNFSRVSPLIGRGFRYKGYDVVRALEEAARRFGKPNRIRVDNGPESLQTMLLSNRSTAVFGRSA